jgi:dihydroorotate dehydrogenase
MPDWSYQTMFRPLLFQIPSALARDFTLQAMGSLSRIPGGSLVIRTMGHMESSPILVSELAGIELRYPVGLSGSLDPTGTAHQAMAQFGIGFIEIGPVTVREVVNRGGTIQRDAAKEAIIYPDAEENAGLDKTVRRLQRKQGHQLPLMIRTRSTRGSSPQESLRQQQLLMEGLLPYAASLYIDCLNPSWSLEEALSHVDEVWRIGHSVQSRLELPIHVPAARNVPDVDALNGIAQVPASDKLPLLLYIPLDYPLAKLRQLLEAIPADRWSGYVIGEAFENDSEAVIGREGKQACSDRVGLIRELTGAQVKIIATAGVHEPQDALELMQAGASYVQLHSGLVYAGPGLPKRINEAVIWEKIRTEKPPVEPSFWHSWGWMCLLGMGMIIGGILAWIIAATSVVLPYDIRFLSMQPSAIKASNPFVLLFMSHDRVTLAGTMVSIGVLYFQLAYFGLRKGQHWAKTALMTSGLVGFSSFFLYLGYGYFDPLHAIAAALLLPLFIVSMMRSTADLPSYQMPSLRNDRTWLRAQWGQFMMVVLGFSLAIGGIVISIVGITKVFVPEDLAFLCATPAMIAEINERLIPLIAHDRAGFGGALFSNAIALLAAALWGVNEGRRWLWWTFLLGGLPGFLAGFSVHWEIGYTDFWHLLPAYFAALLYVLGLVLLYPYLCPTRKRGENRPDEYPINRR